MKGFEFLGNKMNNGSPKMMINVDDNENPIIHMKKKIDKMRTNMWKNLSNFGGSYGVMANIPNIYYALYMIRKPYSGSC